MPILQKRPRKAEGKIHWLPVEDIRPGKAQPRRVFAQDGIEELAQSISCYGVLQPLTVRRRQNWYELIAGERRLRAAKLAGLTEVPCLISEANMEEASVLALVENLQRQDLNFWEEAEGISRLVKVFGMSQEEAARRIGKSQSAVANKLRLLKLPPDILESLRENSLTERHGRALLRLQDADRQRDALMYIIDNNLTVSATDAYIEALISAPEALPAPEKSGARRTFILKDVRVFLNTLAHSIDLMKQGGIDAGVRREETEDSLILTISIPKSKA